MKAVSVQKSMLDNYFCYLQEYGYLTPPITKGVLFAIMLLDSFDYFKEFITPEFQKDVAHIMMRLDCCNCVVYIDSTGCEDDNILLEGMTDKDDFMYLPSLQCMNNYGYVPLRIKVDSEGYAHFID